MPINKEIIDSLTIKQKLAFLAGNYVEGLPFLSIDYLENICLENENFYPSLNSLANSWDCELISNISYNLVKPREEKPYSLVVTPRLGIKTNVYSSGLTEDACLCEQIAKAYKMGIYQSGAMPVLSSCALENSDADFLDLKVRKSVVRDYFIKPFEVASSGTGINAILTSGQVLSGDYADVNLNLVNKILHNKRFISAPIICDGFNPDHAAKLLTDGNILLLKGNQNPLEYAYEHFLSLQNSLEKGSITVNEFNSACENGSVLSEKTIDDSVLRLLNLAEECEKCSSNKKQIDVEREQLSMRASGESIVLVKNNNNTLPFKKKIKVAVVGELAVQKNGASFIDELSNKNLPFEYKGFSAGYEELGYKRNDEMILNARKLSESSDVVLLFLGFDNELEVANLENKSLSLPVHQLALVDELSKTGKQIVAVVCGDYPFDMSFDADLSATLIMPLGGKYSFNALLKILSGEVNPSGKLANSLYDNTEEFFAQNKLQKDLKRVKIGAFFGYRYYDTAEEKIKYPFGHGLSYASFTYSKLKVGFDGVKVMVKNTGKFEGSVVVQFYLGKDNSETANPKKELCGFVRVNLKPGQSRNIKIKINYSDYAICDEKDGEKKVEKGNYTIFVATSATNVCLKKSFKVPGCEISESKENLSDYFSTKSNIVSGRYTLENIQKKKFTKPLIFLIAAVAFTLVYDIIFSFLSFGITEVILLILLNFLLVPFSVVGIIFEVRKLIRYNKNLTDINLTNRENETELNSELSLEQLFLNEFKENTENIIAQKTSDEITGDVKTTAISVSRQLELFMKERGLTVEGSSVRSVISAFFASRCVLLKSNDQSLLNEFISNLNEFFGTSSYIEDFSKNFDSANRLLFNADENGEKVETAIIKAIKDAENAKKLLHLVSLSEVEFPKMESMLMPIINYAYNPLNENKILAQDKNNQSEFVLPPNLWFILLPAENSSLDSLPPYFAENAFVIDVKLRKVAKKEERSSFPIISFQQFLFLSESNEKETADAERLFKKIDSITEYVNSRAKYEIGNKEWRRIENFVFTYISCEGTEAEAAESVVYAKLMPKIMPLLKNANLTEDNEFSFTLKKILGEDNFKRR